MKIWWCQEHEATGDSSNYCFEELWLVAVDKIVGPCRMVPMRLIPDNAPGREKRVARVAELLHEFLARYADQPPFFDNLKPDARVRYFKEAVSILAALDGETP